MSRKNFLGIDRIYLTAKGRLAYIIEAIGSCGTHGCRNITVKYEMLRQVQLEGASKAEAAALFGVSRPTFYQTESAFAQAGLAGLLPRQRGPKGAHKLTSEVMSFIEQHLSADGQVHARVLARQIHAQLGLSVHPRSIERALARKKKR